jgi:hypothetical protein
MVVLRLLSELRSPSAGVDAGPDGVCTKDVVKTVECLREEDTGLLMYDGCCFSGVVADMRNLTIGDDPFLIVEFG